MNRPSYLATLMTVAALVAMGTPASAAPAATPENFSVTLSLTATTDPAPPFGGVALRGEGVVPMIGRATVQGFVFADCFAMGETALCLNQLFLQARGRSERFLNMESFDTWLPLEGGEPPPEWTWSSSGFGFTGSGTYETSEPVYSFEGALTPVIVIENGEVITITISGTLHPSRD